MSLLKVNEVQNYNGSSLTLTASTVSTSAQLNTGGNISVTGSINVSDDSTTRSNLGLGSIATQAADSVDIDGGTIDGATIGGSTAAAGTFTTFTSNGIDDNATSTALTIDTDGKVFIGADTSITGIFGSSPSKLGISGTASPLIIETVGENAFGSRIDLLKTRGTTSNSKTIVNNADTLGEIYFGGTDGTSALPSARIFAQVDGTPGTNDMPGRLVFSTTADGASSTTERMRIDSSGNVLISGSDNDPASNGISQQIALRSDGRISARGADNFATFSLARGGTDGPIAYFIKETTSVGSISVTGSSTSFNTSSDYRLKENITKITDGINRVKQLNPSRFNFIVEPDNTVDGFIAHEVSDIVPEAISGEKDAVNEDGNPEYQGIDQSKLVPLLTAALQESIALIESQQSQIDALTARIEALETA